MLRHGATYAGHPSCCAAALAVLDIYERENLIPRGRELERPLADALAPLADHPAVAEVRAGCGPARRRPALAGRARARAGRGRQGRRRARARRACCVRPLLGSIAVSPPLDRRARSTSSRSPTALRAGLDRLGRDWPVSEYPELRAGPPWVTEEMVAAQPALARALLDAPPDGVAASPARSARRTAPACRSPSSAAGRPSTGRWRSPALLDAALGGGWPPPVVVAPVARRGRAPAARRRLHRGLARRRHARDDARARGRRRRAARRRRWSPRGPAGRPSGPAEHVLVTPVHDDSWCHTVAYTSSILVGAALARELGLEGVDGAGGRGAAARRARRRRDARRSRGAERVLVRRAPGSTYITRARAGAEDRRGRARRRPPRSPRDAAARPPRRRGRRHRAVLVAHRRGAARIERRAGARRRRAWARSACRSSIARRRRRRRPGAAAGAAAGRRGRASGADARARARPGREPDLIRREEEPYRRAGDVTATVAGDW